MNAPCPNLEVKLIQTVESGSVVSSTVNQDVIVPFSDNLKGGDEASATVTPGCGIGVGTKLGRVVGTFVGVLVGTPEGTGAGRLVGTLVGAFDGTLVGTGAGTLVGTGAGILVGREDGNDDGTKLGPKDGSSVGRADGSYVCGVTMVGGCSDSVPCTVGAMVGERKGTPAVPCAVGATVGEPKGSSNTSISVTLGAAAMMLSWNAELSSVDATLAATSLYDSCTPLAPCEYETSKETSHDISAPPCVSLYTLR